MRSMLIDPFLKKENQNNDDDINGQRIFARAPG